MKRLQAFKYKLMPNDEQRRQMRRFAGSCRFVFNKALALQKERYEQGEKRLGYAGLCKELTAWRNGVETPWLSDSPIHPLQHCPGLPPSAHRAAWQSKPRQFQGLPP